jgi:hypothetical protein
VIESQGPDNAAPIVGWSVLLSDTTVDGFAVFRQQIGSGCGSESIIPFEKPGIVGQYSLAFDNTNGLNTGVALTNLRPQLDNIETTIRDDNGAILDSDTIPLPALGHLSFSVADRYPVTRLRHGTIEFKGPVAPLTFPVPIGKFRVLGFSFNSRQGGFSSIAPLYDDGGIGLPQLPPVFARYCCANAPVKGSDGKYSAKSCTAIPDDWEAINACSFTGSATVNCSGEMLVAGTLINCTPI